MLLANNHIVGFILIKVETFIADELREFAYV